MFEYADTVRQQAVIKVIGVGGGGGNAVEYMIKADLDGVEFINANTDAQALGLSNAPTVLQIGENLTKGLGAGAKPEVGRQAAIDDKERIAAAIEGADMLFITAGMGGGTGTGAAPIIAELARERDILTVAVVSRPFLFEGKRLAIAEQGIEELQDHVDSLIIIPNEKLLAVMGHDAKVVDAFNKANEVLFNAVQGISELITLPGLVNTDFSDVRTVMAETGMAMMGSASASGENRAVEAAQQAVSSPLLEDVNLHGAKALLVNITATTDMTMSEFHTVSNTIHEYAAEDATIVVGVAFDPSMAGELRVTMIATGLQDSRLTVVGNPANAQAPTRQGSGQGIANADSGDEIISQRPGSRKPFARAGNSTVDAVQTNMDHFDIPPFLRKQAD